MGRPTGGPGLRGGDHRPPCEQGRVLTTGTFTREAAEYVKNLDKTVVLIDGERLAELMIEFNLGATLEQTYEIKRIDSDFFEE